MTRKLFLGLALIVCLTLPSLPQSARTPEQVAAELQAGEDAHTTVRAARVTESAVGEPAVRPAP